MSQRDNALALEQMRRAVGALVMPSTRLDLRALAS
jgi:hypothetical protein